MAITATVIAVVLDAGCWTKVAVGADMAELKELDADLKAIAMAAVRERFPDFDANRYPLRVVDGGNHFVVDFVLPPDMIGGSPVVQINKSTRTVIKLFRTQ